MGKRSFGGLSGAPLEARKRLWSSGGRGGFWGGLRHAIVVFLYPDRRACLLGQFPGMAVMCILEAAGLSPLGPCVLQK